MKKIRSFVRRESRNKQSREKIFEKLWPQYGLNPRQRLVSKASVFGREAPWILDIGFGDGEGLCTIAKQHPQLDFVGVEVYESGVAILMRELEAQAIQNVKIYCHDVHEVLENLPKQCVAGTQIFFPDPWPKKRHWKRRLVQKAFLEKLVAHMEEEAWLHVVTDWTNYAECILEALAHVPMLSPLHQNHASKLPLLVRPETKYERKAKREGRAIHSFALSTSPAMPSSD